MTMDDTRQFGRPDLEHRLLHGGLPEFFLAERPDERRFQELMDAYWARDVMELFRLERRHSFARFAEILMLQSGGVFEATRFTRPCEVSRPTITNYLALLEATFVVHVVRPFSGNPSREIVAAPKVYWFDTGFVCAWRGWDRLRPEDVGVLWEHFVLNEMHARLQSRGVRYWRSKHGNEVDFVLSMPGRPPVAIECKRSSGDFDPRHLLAFRSLYPGGQNLVVATDVSRRYARSYRGMDVTFVDLDGLFDVLNRGHS
jgi:predicted AAA+ superfamily ATPase